VTAIPGIRAYFIDLIGRQDHPGGVPMDRRRDAMAAAAEIITRAIAKAEALGRPALTTTGRILVDPNYPMFVPGKVTFSLDARHPDPGAFEELWRHHAEVVREVTARRQVGVTWTLKATHAPCPSDPATVTLLEDTARQLDIPTMRLTSGAVHDAMEMGKRFKMAMIFVRSEGGRSHTPVEFTSIPDAVAGIEVLAAALHRLAY